MYTQISPLGNEDKSYNRNSWLRIEALIAKDNECANISPKCTNNDKNIHA